MFISNYKAYILNTKCKLSETSDLCGSPHPMPPVHGGLVTGSSGGGRNLCHHEFLQGGKFFGDVMQFQAEYKRQCFCIFPILNLVVITLTCFITVKTCRALCILECFTLSLISEKLDLLLEL